MRLKEGLQIGELTVDKKSGLKFHKEDYWTVRCSCGSTICVPPSGFADGKLKSCGCVSSVLLISSQAVANECNTMGIDDD